MVNLKTLDVTMSTIAVLLEPPAQPITLNREVLEGVLRAPLSLAVGLGGQTLVNGQRDQIEVVSGENRINVRDLSGATQFTKSKIPPVLHTFVELYGTPISSYGVNFQIVIDLPNSGEWIRDNILRGDITKKTRRELLGGSVGLRVHVAPKTWNIRFEASNPNRLNLDFNAHELKLDLPDQDRLREELREQFRSFKDFLRRLG